LLTETSMRTLLEDLMAGRALERARESLRAWEADENPMIRRDQVEPEDMVLVYAAQERALLSFLPHFTSAPERIFGVVGQLRAHYALLQKEALQVFTRTREALARRQALLEAEREAAVATAEEFQALNEELTAQSEELTAQQEELHRVHDQLKRQHAHVEAEVARRTEELQAANEELQTQSEELEAQHEEIVIANEELAAQRTFIELVLNGLPASVGYMDLSGTIQLVNEQFAANYDKRPEDFVGLSFTAAFPALATQMAAPLNKVLETGEAWKATGFPYDHPFTGERTYRDFSIVPVADARGATVGLLSLSFDATERVLLEQEVARQTSELAREKAFVENLVRHVPTGIAFLDREEIVRWVNPTFASFVGRPEAAFVDQSYYDLFPQMARPNPRIRQVLESGLPHRVEGLEAAMPDGGTTYWDIVYVPVLSETGEIEGALLMTQEATLRVRHAQEQEARIEHLRQVDRLKDEFLSVLSHELRTPINAIMGFASILEDEVSGPLNGDQRRFTHRILASSDVLLGLINDLLDLSRIQAGRFSLDPARMEFRAVAEEVVSTLAHLAEQKQQALTLELPPDLPPLEADSQRVSQVLMNLIGNAIKFSREAGTVTVRARADGGFIRCEVADQGVGIAPDDLPKLFQRFTQLHTGLTRSAGGAGLGLSIVKSMVEAHGGEVGVESEPERGSTFWFTLPLGR
ncbi:MAG: ATP-binding protein, partial [Candidatus Sericytochromatia bacterium]